MLNMCKHNYYNIITLLSVELQNIFFRLVHNKQNPQSNKFLYKVKTRTNHILFTPHAQDINCYLSIMHIFGASSIADQQGTFYTSCIN